MEHSPFARLPPELRSRMYYYALKRDEAITFSLRPPYNTRIALGEPPGLPRTCKALRSESRPIFFSANCFCIKDRGDGSTLRTRAAWRYLCDVAGPDGVGALRHVTLEADEVLCFCEVGRCRIIKRSTDMLHHHLVKLRATPGLHQHCQLAVVFCEGYGQERLVLKPQRSWEDLGRRTQRS